MKIEELKKEIPYRWRVQSFTKTTKPEAICVAYIDARQVMDLLDEVVGHENWQSDFKRIGENLISQPTSDSKNQKVFPGSLFGGIGILIKDKWVWKWDCGAETDIEKEKGEASDAFKRAAVHWGIGRFLYDLEMLRIPAADYNGKSKPANAAGKILWSNDELSDYCNSIRNPKLDKRVELGDTMVKSHFISEIEKATWEKHKNNPDKIKQSLDYLEKKNHLGEKMERAIYIKEMAKIKDGQTKADIQKKVRDKVIKEFTPLTLPEAEEKYKKQMED